MSDNPYETPDHPDPRLEQAITKGNRTLVKKLIGAKIPLTGEELVCATYCKGQRALMLKLLLEQHKFEPADINHAAFVASLFPQQAEVHRTLKAAGADNHARLMGMIVRASDGDSPHANRLARMVDAANPLASHYFHTIAKLSESASLILFQQGVRPPNSEKTWSLGEAAEEGYLKLVTALAKLPAKTSEFARKQALVAAIENEPMVLTFNLLLCENPQATAAWCLDKTARYLQPEAGHILFTTIHQLDAIRRLALGKAICFENLPLLRLMIQGKVTNLQQIAGIIKDTGQNGLLDQLANPKQVAPET